MVEPICEDEGLLQEWTPQTQLLQQIPQKIQRGLFSQNLSLTCLDVVSDYMSLGTNLGFVYWYCRVDGELQKLRFENSHCAVTCVKILSSVDHMVAAGTNLGTLIVFRIPKIEPTCTQEQSKAKQKQIERFTINDLHNAPVSSIEWDQNELKVFSGDRNGVVALTEIDYTLHISKSMELLNEQFEIIQLSFSHQILLISTIYRSIICDGSNNWSINQVGTKERKILGRFGATFCNFHHGLVLYASRPGYRLWLSDKNGIVQQTLIFKSAMQSNCPKIQLINPVDTKKSFDASFGKVLQFGENKLITYNSEILYILHPGAVSVVSVLDGARKILDLAVNENEIFILEGERSLLRISPLPDKYSDTMNQAISRRTSFNLDEFAARIKDTAVESLKKITKDFIITPEQTSPNSPPAVADEALELPPVVNFPSKVLPAIYASGDIEIHSSVQNDSTLNDYCSDLNSSFSPNSVNPFAQDCQEEVITRPLRKRRQKKTKNSKKSQDSLSDSISIPSEDRLVWGVANDLSLSEESAFSESQSSFSVLCDISSILNQPKTTPKKFEKTDETLKTSDSKSQTSLDTCESVSERLVLTSEMFREEQEKIFARLANRSLLDSFNSERTDNMSISLNMTSSSTSSKISENLQSPSYTSETSNAASRAKSNESRSLDNLHIDQELSSRDYSRSNSNIAEENSSRDGKVTDSTDGSLSSRNSLRERLYPRWSDKEMDDAAEEGLKPVENETVEEISQNKLCKKNFNLNENHDEIETPNNVSQNGDTNVQNNFLGNEVAEFPAVDSKDLKQLHCGTKFQDKKDDENVEKSLPSLEPLSYGPPSGSSMLSSQPSSDFSSIPTSHIFQSNVRDSFDLWPQYNTPDQIISFDACNNYVVCTDINLGVYYSNLSGLSLNWTGLNLKALMVKVSNDGSLFWILTKKKTLVALVNPSPMCPTDGVTEEIAQNIKTFAIDSANNEGWIVTLNGTLLKYRNKSKEEILVGCKLIDVACCGGLVFGLTVDYALVCKPSVKEDFRLIKTIKPSINCLAVGPKDLLWTVDDANNIYYSDDFLSQDPHWWQIEISDYIFQNSTRSFQNSASKLKPNELATIIYVKNALLATNDNSVWIFNKFTSSVCVNKTGFTGYIWDKVSSVKLLPSIHWHKICAEGVVKDLGRVWLLSLDGDIFCVKLNCQQFQSVPVPCEDKVLCMTSTCDTLWVLSENGRIHSRIGLTESNILGISWQELKTSQIDNLRLIWVSCGQDVAWACDKHGRTFITSGSHQEMSTIDLAWREVEGRPKDVKFNKVFVGAQFYMVWAIDNKLNLYVREGICPHYQIGTSWVYVCGIKAVHITISGTSVWALSPSGEIYRRCGISESNYIGDYWKIIPGKLKVISSSFTDEIWGINQENEIVRLRYNFKILNEERMNEIKNRIYSSKEDVSWEIVE